MSRDVEIDLDFSCKDVSKWVMRLGKNFELYAPLFLNNGINGTLLLTLSDRDLQDLGIPVELHRRRILLATEQSRKKHADFTRHYLHSSKTSSNSTGTSLVLSYATTNDRSYEVRSEPSKQTEQDMMMDIQEMLFMKRVQQERRANTRAYLTSLGERGRHSPEVQQCASQFQTLVFLTLLVIVSGVLTAVLFKLCVSKFGIPYVFFLTLITTVLTIAFTGLFVLTQPNRSLPQQFSYGALMLFGLAEALSVFLSFWGGVELLGQHQQVLNQSVIPLTMLLSYFILPQAKYRAQEWLSGFLLGFSVILLFIQPRILADGWDRGSTVVYFLANLPRAMSIVYLQKYFKETQFNPFTFVLHTSIWRLVFIIPLGIVLQLLPIHIGDRSALTIIKDTYDGLLCMLAVNQTAPSGMQCVASVPYIILYVFSQFIHHLASINLTGISHQSNVGIFLCSSAHVVSIIIAYIVFTWRFVMRSDVEEFNPLTFICFLLVILGLCVYLYHTNRRSDNRDLFRYPIFPNPVLKRRKRSELLSPAINDTESLEWNLVYEHAYADTI